MVMQTGKYWVSDYLSLFLRGISFWYFLSYSLMWPFLIIVSDIFSKDISSLCFNEDNEPVKGSSYCVENQRKQPLFLAVFFKMGGIW